MTGLMPPILLEGLKALAWYILSPDMFRCEVTETRTVQLELKTERFGMAYRLLFAYAFVRAESEQNFPGGIIFCLPDTSTIEEAPELP
jgi:hypothetical protein